MNYNINLVEKGDQPMLEVRKTTSVGQLPQEIGKAYDEIIRYLGEIGELPSGSPFVAYYNMDMEHLDVEMGFPVSKQLKGKGDVNAGTIPAGRYVECLYRGPYQGSVPVYDAINKWISEKHIEATGTVYEYYYNSPEDVPEEELITKIVFAVK